MIKLTCFSCCLYYWRPMELWNMQCPQMSTAQCRFCILQIFFFLLSFTAHLIVQIPKGFNSIYYGYAVTQKINPLWSVCVKVCVCVLILYLLPSEVFILTGTLTQMGTFHIFSSRLKMFRVSFCNLIKKQ